MDGNDETFLCDNASNELAPLLQFDTALAPFWKCSNCDTQHNNKKKVRR